MCFRFLFLTFGTMLMIGGCSSTASQSSPESVRDPLGIDRAINDYYFPNADTENADNLDAYTPEDERVVRKEPSTTDGQP